MENRDSRHPTLNSVTFEMTHYRTVHRAEQRQRAAVDPLFKLTNQLGAHVA
jgi:hypothetical protein